MSDQTQNPVNPAEVKNLAELLQYQNSSIVSRVLLKNKGGTVTLFAFDVGEGLSEHTAPFDALARSAAHNAILGINGKRSRLAHWSRT